MRKNVQENAEFELTYRRVVHMKVAMSRTAARAEQKSSEKNVQYFEKLEMPSFVIYITL